MNNIRVEGEYLKESLDLQAKVNAYRNRPRK